MENENMEKAHHRVEAFNDLAAIFTRDDFSIDGLSDEQNAEVRRVVSMCCTNAACMAMVGAGITTYAEIQRTGSSHWPATADGRVE